MLKTIALLSLLATPAFACDGVMPPKGMREPTVPYEIYHLRAADFAKYCAPFHYGCTYHAPTKRQPTRWAVVVNDDVPFDEVACTIIYERAHLPPNYWGDPKVETPEGMADLARMKREHALY